MRCNKSEPTFQRRLVVTVVLAFCGYVGQSQAQLSSVVDCSDVARQAKNFEPLSRAEKIELIENQFSVEVSRFQQCEEENAKIEDSDLESSKETSYEISGNHTDSATNAMESAGGATAFGLPSESSTDVPAGKKASLSSNALVDGEKSAAFSNQGHQISDMDFMGDRDSIESSVLAKPGLRGQQHEKLESADNLRILKAQIKARAEVETDPAVRNELLKRYEEL